MTNSEKEIIRKLVLHRISKSESLEQMNLTESTVEEYVLSSLNLAYETRDSDAIAYTLYFGYGVTGTERFVTILCKLIVQDWHVSHENIALLLQQIKSPGSIGCLHDAIFIANKLDYFYDNGAALIRKCCFGLGDINTSESHQMLKNLAMSNDDVIKKCALEQLELHKIGW